MACPAAIPSKRVNPAPINNFSHAGRSLRGAIWTSMVVEVVLTPVEVVVVRTEGTAIPLMCAKTVTNDKYV